MVEPEKKTRCVWDWREARKVHTEDKGLSYKVKIP